MEGHATTALKMKKNPIQGTEEVLHLIELVKTYPCLWKDSDRQYKNVEIRHQAWVEIGSYMGHSSEDVHQKWKNLMNTYRRTKKEIARSQVTGSGSSEVLQNCWFAFEHMSFLHDATAKQPTVNSANLEDESPAPSTSAMLPGRTPQPKRKRTQTSRSEQIAECLGALRRLTEATPRPMSKARALGNFVEARVAVYEQSHPEFCDRLIEAVTATLNEEVAKFNAPGSCDHDYV